VIEMDNKKEKERVTKSITISISIPEKLYKELSDLAEEKGKTISQVIKTTLRHARAALWDAEYSEILRKEKKSDLLKVGDPLEYSPLRYFLGPSLRSEEKEKPQSNQVKEKQK